MVCIIMTFQYILIVIFIFHFQNFKNPKRTFMLFVIFEFMEICKDDSFDWGMCKSNH